MADERDDTPKRAVPEWQRSSGDGGSDNPSGPQDRLDVARRFLDDDEVKTAPRDKKVAFLQAKGIADADITKLLGDADSSTSTSDNVSRAGQSPRPICRIFTDGSQESDPERRLIASNTFYRVTSQHPLRILVIIPLPLQPRSRRHLPRIPSQAPNRLAPATRHHGRPPHNPPDHRRSLRPHRRLLPPRLHAHDGGAHGRA